MVFTGHDHSYLRTHPIRSGESVHSPAKGTTYIIAVAGTKHYEQGDFDYAALTIPESSTYQVIDIQTKDEDDIYSRDRLLYRAYDIDGNLVDSLEILRDDEPE